MSCATVCGAQCAVELADLNRRCYCMPLDQQKLTAAVVAESGSTTIAGLLAARPHLFAATPVFVCQKDIEAMSAVVAAVEAVVQNTHFARSVLGNTRPDRSTNGLLMGYDFHVTVDGPRLIEVNTNAGGAFLVQRLLAAVAAQAVTSRAEFCTGTLVPPFVSDAQLAEMFCSEFQAAGRAGRPQHIAIVDDDVNSQYLLPDMLLAEQLLRDHNLRATVVEASQLQIDDGVLMLHGEPVDFVYNRLTDFQLAAHGHEVLRRAYEQDLAVVTPAPHHHALFANKRNLGVFGDAEKLRNWQVPQHHIDALATIPLTEPVTVNNAEELWARRRDLFFKPVAGFGSRAAYRGAKVTTRVWREIVAGDYVAQAFVPPTVRGVGQVQSELKYDVRIYTFAGTPLSMAARVYQGQTTNFRTPGGGFAPIVSHS